MTTPTSTAHGWVQESPSRWNHVSGAVVELWSDGWVAKHQHGALIGYRFHSRFAAMQAVEDVYPAEKVIDLMGALRQSLKQGAR